MKVLERLLILEIKYQHRTRVSTAENSNRLLWKFHSDHVRFAAKLGEVTRHDLLV
jgi:hypothetical protein